MKSKPSVDIRLAHYANKNQLRPSRLVELDHSKTFSSWFIYAEMLNDLYKKQRRLFSPFVDSTQSMLFCFDSIADATPQEET